LKNFLGLMRKLGQHIGIKYKSILDVCNNIKLIKSIMNSSSKLNVMILTNNTA